MEGIRPYNIENEPDEPGQNFGWARRINQAAKNVIQEVAAKVNADDFFPVAKEIFNLLIITASVVGFESILDRVVTQWRIDPLDILVGGVTAGIILSEGMARLNDSQPVKWNPEVKVDPLDSENFPFWI